MLEELLLPTFITLSLFVSIIGSLSRQARCFWSLGRRLVATHRRSFTLGKSSAILHRHERFSSWPTPFRQSFTSIHDDSHRRATTYTQTNKPARASFLFSTGLPKYPYRLAVRADTRPHQEMQAPAIGLRIDFFCSTLSAMGGENKRESRPHTAATLPYISRRFDRLCVSTLRRTATSGGSQNMI
jgi:hypothetical protein